MIRSTFSLMLLTACACAAFTALAAPPVDVARIQAEPASLVGRWTVYPADPENIALPVANPLPESIAAEQGGLVQAYWFTTALHNSSSNAISLILEIDAPLIPRVEAFALTGNHPPVRQLSGSAVRAAEKTLVQPQPALPVTIPANSTTTLYLYAETSLGLDLPTRLWRPTAFYAKQQTHTFVAAAGLGVILVMALYNLLIWSITRDVRYRDLAALVGSLLLTLVVAQGWGGTLLWPNAPELTLLLVGPALALAMCSLLKFCQRLLRMPVPGIASTVINLTCWFNAVMALWLATSPSWALATKLMIVNLPVICLPLLHAARQALKRNRDARQFLLAVTPLIGMAVLAFCNRIFTLGYAPSTMQAALLLACAFLSINLAVLLALQIRRANVERDAAYEALLLAQKDLRVVENQAAAATRDNQAKTAFLATMSHEIRTPMNGVLGMADLLLHTRIDQQQEYYLATLTRSGQALMDILNDVLDYSKVESGKLELEHIRTDLIELLDDLVMLFREPLRRKSLNCYVLLHPEVGQWINTDPTRLKQILSNLMSNAVKFTEQGDVVLRIRRTDEGSLRFELTDDGIGMDAATRNRLFTRFEQADSSISRRYGGTGLGLAISRHLVELFGGEIHVDSEPGQGSTFSFTIRCDDASGDTLQPDLRQLCVLSADDHLIESLELLAARWEVPFIAARSWDDDIDETLAFLTPADVLIVDEELPAPVTTNVVSIHNDDLNLPLSYSELVNVISAHVTAQGGSDVSTSQPLSTMDVLVAEDNPTNRLVVGKILNNWGANVRFVENGLEARDLFAQDHDNVDLVLMDCEMPEMDGYTATSAIRRLERDQALAETPIIALTAHVLPEFRIKARDVGMSDYITKPIDRDALLAAILKQTKPDQTARHH